MSSIRNFRFWELKLAVFLAVVPFLATANTLSTSSGDVNIEDLLTGHVQISRDSVPTQLLPCLTQPDLVATSDCQFRHSQWNNMHCLNNSFGMYADDNNFLNFGSQPLGIVFPSLFFNPIASYSGSSGCSSGNEDQTRKIETLLEANAEAKMNITLLGEMIEELQREKRQLEEELDSVRQQNIEQNGQIHIYKLQAERWEEVHNECASSSVIHRNTTSIALRAAQDHIHHLEIQNQMFVDANSKCSLDLRSLQEFLSVVQQTSEENEIKLARCSVNLTASRQSEEATQSALAQEEKEHLRHIEEYQQERRMLMTEILNAQTSRASCEASLNDIRSVYEETKINYENCLGNIGGTNARLDLCRSALNLCHGNHSVATNAGQLCEQEHRLCLSEAAHLKDSLASCQNNSLVLQENIRSLKESEQTLTEQIMSLRSEAESARLSETHLQSVVKDLRINLQDVRNALSDTEAQLRECSLDIVTARTSLDIAHNKAEEFSGQLDALRQRYTTLSRKNYITVTEYSALREAYTLLKNDDDKCHALLDDASASAQRLIQNEAACHEQLNNVTTTLSVIESQRDACLNSHHSSIDQLDEWRVRYQDISTKLTRCTIQYTNCSGQLNMMTNLYNALEEEADEMQTLNFNLKDRLNATLESLSSMTSSYATLRAEFSVVRQESTDLNKQIANLEATADAEKSRYETCSSRISSYTSQVTTLESRLSDIASSASALHQHLNHCSQQLNETRASLHEQHDINAEQERHLMSVQSSLEVAQSQHHGVVIQVESLERQLKHCQSNHSESLTESLSLEMQLLECNRRITQVQTNSLRDIERIQALLMDCQISHKRTTESLNDTLLSNERYQMELRRMEAEHNSTKKSYQTCRMQVSIYARRVSNLEALARNLRSDASTLQARLTSSNHEHAHTREQLTLCRELKSKQELQLFDITEELEECHASSHVSTSWSSGCPSTDQGAFASTSSGCLMVTRSTGSAQEMETLCSHLAGSHLMNRMIVMSPLFQTDVSRLVTDGHLPRTPVWLSSDDGSCHQVDLNLSDGPMLVQSRACTDSLPGLCMTSHSHDTSLSDSTYTFNSSSTHIAWSSVSGFNESSILDNLGIYLG